MPTHQQPPKDVFAIVERGNNQRSIWIRIGVAFVNNDESLTLRLHAVPLTGVLQVRERRQDAQRQNRREPEPNHDRGNGGGAQPSDDYPF